jgi:hypothetical protein
MENPQKTVYIKFLRPWVFVQWHLAQKMEAKSAAIIFCDGFKLIYVQFVNKSWYCRKIQDFLWKWWKIQVKKIAKIPRQNKLFLVEYNEMPRTSGRKQQFFRRNNHEKAQSKAACYAAAGLPVYWHDPCRYGCSPPDHLPESHQ